MNSMVWTTLECTWFEVAGSDVCVANADVHDQTICCKVELRVGGQTTTQSHHIRVSSGLVRRAFVSIGET